MSEIMDMSRFIDFSIITDHFEPSIDMLTRQSFPEFIPISLFILW